MNHTGIQLYLKHTGEPIYIEFHNEQDRNKVFEKLKKSLEVKSIDEML